MGLFQFLKTPKPNQFTYHPRFYDEKKEAFQERLQEARKKKGDDPEAMKARIRNSLSRRSGYLSDKSYRSRHVMRSNLLLLVIIVALIILVYVAIELYLPRFVQMFEQ
jgi:hypothetical protein